jgi:DNA adenine methylase
MLKPILKYPGGKGRELKYILPVVPRGMKRYFEPFVGGGAAYFSLQGAQEYFINDFSKELIATYQAVQTQDACFFCMLSQLNEDWKQLSSASSAQSLSIVDCFGLKDFFDKYCSKMSLRKKAWEEQEKQKGNLLTEANKQSVRETVLKSTYYATVRELYSRNRKSGKLRENAAFYFFMREFCYSSMFRFSADGSFNVPYGGMSYNSKNFDEKLLYLRSAPLVSRLHQTEIRSQDFQEFLSSFALASDDFIFLDPPYDTEFSTYDENEFGEADQTRLAAFLRSTPAKWLLVIKDTDLIRSLYPQSDKRIFYKEFGKNYAVSFMNRNNKKVNHLMISNYKET